MKNRHLKKIFLGVVLLSAIPAANLLCLYLFPSLRVIFLSLSGISVLAVIAMRERAELKTSYIVLCVLLPVTAPLLVVSVLCLAYRSRLMMPRGGRDTLPDTSGLPRLIRGAAAAAMTHDPIAEMIFNFSSEYFSGGEAMAEDILNEISLAEEFIYLEYYIVCEGEFLDRLIDALATAASRGVRVSLIYDDLGSMLGVPEDFSLRLGRMGILAVPFSPVSPSAWRTNSRDHRKLLIIDGKTVYTGGINISDEYLFGEMAAGSWKDSGLKIRSSEPLSVTDGFEGMLAKACGERIESRVDPPRGHKRRRAVSDAVCIIFSSYPHRIYGRSAAREVMLSLLSAAERSIVIASPYFIPDGELFGGLLRTARRGVDISVILPGVPDKRLVKAVAESFYDEMLSAGIKIYEYTPGFLHSKIILIDGAAALVGSINFDQRSLYQNFECAALIYGSAALTDIKIDVDMIINESSRVKRSHGFSSVKKKAVGLVFEAALPIL